MSKFEPSMIICANDTCVEILTGTVEPIRSWPSPREIPFHGFASAALSLSSASWDFRNDDGGGHDGTAEGRVVGANPG